MAYITFDFGSSNSGAILNTAYGKEYNPNELIFVHSQAGDAEFTKQPTKFWIKRSLLEKDTFSEDDIHIYSCVFHEPTLYASNANFIWCKNQIKDRINILSNDPNWVHIQHPKMELYKKNNRNPSNTIIYASDGTQFSLRKVLKIFFLVIKKECLQKAKEDQLILSENDVNWSITVPGMAIWNQDAVDIIKEVGYSVFGKNLKLWSEPECALIGINISGKANIDFVKDRLSLVVDLGGGTADISVMKESLDDNGSISFQEVNSTKEGNDPTTSKHAGGNDIDNNFKSYFCDFVTKDIEFIDTRYTNFKKDNPSGDMEFDTEWHKLQFSEAIDEETIYFNPGRFFVKWLQIHYPAAAKKRDEFGYFIFDGKELRDYVFSPIYNIILNSIEENLSILKQNKILLNVVYFAGGLSRDKRLKKRIKDLCKHYYPDVGFKEASEGSVVGAVQRGGNHITVNKELIHRLSRRTFYTSFATKYNGDENELRDILGGRLRSDYYERFGIWLSDEEIYRILDKQWPNLKIDYNDGTVSYLSPLCLRYTPTIKIESILICPVFKGKQKEVLISVYSSDKNYIIIKNEETKYEGEFKYNFGYYWESAKLVFDPTSNAVEGTALFYLTDNDGNKLNEYVIKNVSKYGY